MIYIFLFIIGLAFGSFLNVVSLRYKPEQKIFDLKIIGGRSRCPNCSKQLTWYELVPLLSFLAQKRKCRHCKHKISFQYPIVELLGGLIFVFVPMHFNLFQSFIIFKSLFLITLVWIIIFLLFLLLAVIDFYHYIIPDGINILLAVFGLVLVFIYSKLHILNFNLSFLGHYAMLFGSFGNIWVDHFVSAILAVAFFGLVIILTRGRGMGIGDLKLAGALGLIFGWPDILLALSMSFIIGAAFSLILIFGGRKKIKDAVPFGPFLVIGSVAVFFLGFYIVDLYFKFFGLYF